MPVVPLASQGQGSGATVASLLENPHLATTRPPRSALSAAAAAAAGAAQRPGGGSVRPGSGGGALVPLAQQPKRQQRAMAAPAPAAAAAAAALPSTLMLDPVFGAGLASIAGDRSRESDTSALRQVSAHTLGAEQFQHSATIMGHRVGITSHRVAPGRVMASSAHAATASFANTEGAARAMAEHRTQKRKKKA